MKTNERNIQMTDNRLAGGAALVAVILIATALLAFTWVQPAFAAEEGQSVTITIKVGEHGSVNGKTGEFTETVSLGKEVNFTIECEEGYLIGRVLLNDEPLAADDLKEFLGTSAGGLKLEELDSDLTVEIIFMTTSEYEIQKEYGQVADDLSGGDTSDGSDSQQEQETSGDNGASDENTDPAEDTAGDDPDGMTADPDDTTGDPTDMAGDSADNEGSDNGTDPGDNAGIDTEMSTDDTSENQDSQSDTAEGETGTGTDNSTDQSTTDDMSDNSKDADSSADNDADVTAGEESSSDSAGTGTTETTKQATGIRNETTDSVDATTADSVKDNSDSTDDGKGDYYDTPKTGDVRNPYIWLAICIGGLIMLVISAGNMIRRATRDRNGRWGK